MEAGEAQHIEVIVEQIDVDVRLKVPRLARRFGVSAVGAARGEEGIGGFEDADEAEVHLRWDCNGFNGREVARGDGLLPRRG